MTKLFSAFFLILLTASCRNPSKETSAKTIDSSGVETGNLRFLPSPADTLSAEPYLFSDRNGLVYLSWIEKREEKHWLKFSVLNNNQWSAPSVISSGDNWFVNWADYPQIATDGAKSVVAHFLEKSSKGTFSYDIKLVTSVDKGNSWSDPMIVHDDGKKAEHGFVSIVPYQANYFISWLDGRNAAMEGGDAHHGHHGEMTIRGAVIDKTGKKLSEWELDNRVCDCCQTSAAITLNGPVVVYRDRSDNEIRDISIVRFINGNWTRPKPIFADNWKIDGCPVNGPRIVAEGNNVAVAWFSSPEKNAQVNVAFSEDGGATFSSPVKVDDGKALGRVGIALLDEKTAMVSWMEGSAIKTARVYNSGKKDASILVASTSGSRSSGFPQMTKSGNEIIFAWTDDKEKRIRVASLLMKTESKNQ